MRVSQASGRPAPRSRRPPPNRASAIACGPVGTARLAALHAAEILDADLAPLALELAVWGASAATLPWHAAAAASPGDGASPCSPTWAHRSPGWSRHTAAPWRGSASIPRLAHLVQGRADGAGADRARSPPSRSERDFLRLPPGQRDVDLRHRVDIALSASAMALCG